MAKLRGFWDFRTDAAEDIIWIDKVLEDHDATDFSVQYAEALFSAGFGAMRQGKLQKAKIHFSQSLSQSQMVGADDIAGYAAGLLGNICFDLGEYDANHKFHKISLTIREKLSAAWETGMLTLSMGIQAMEMNHLEDAEQRLKTVAYCMEKLNNHYGLDMAYSYLGKLKTEQGEYDAARNLFISCIGSRDTSNLDAGFLQRFAWLEMAEENLEEAEKLLFDALERFHKLKAWKYVYHCLEDCVTLRARQSLFAHAMMLATYTDQIRERAGTVRPPRSQSYMDDAIDRARSALPSSEIQFAIKRGQEIELEELLDEIGVRIR